MRAEMRASSACSMRRVLAILWRRRIHATHVRLPGRAPAQAREGMLVALRWAAEAAWISKRDWQTPGARTRHRRARAIPRRDAPRCVHFRHAILHIGIAMYDNVQ